MNTVIDNVGNPTIDRVARKVFGEKVDVSCVREIAPSRSHGITETSPSTRNLLYVVELSNHPHVYVFRFSRIDDDVYEQEVQNYELLAESTGVRVPTIYALDTSRSIAPTAFMIMDYLPGKLWNYVAHPDNPNTDRQDKASISEIVGRFYARVHDITRRMPEPGIETQTMLYMIDRLEEAAQRDVVHVTAREIDLCRRAILKEEAFQNRRLSLCLADTEIHVDKKNGEWDLAFVCDAEWVEFRHRFSDLTQVLAGARPWWVLEQPAPDLDPDSIAALPFFQGYDPDGSLDYARLLQLASYFQLGLWSYIAQSSRSPEKRMWVKKAKEPLIRALVGHVSQRATRSRPLVSAV
jgi:hypothetical protein